MLITAHRGAQNPAVENTLDAFLKAVELGPDQIEFDVRRSKDGVLAVIHNNNLAGVKIQESDFAQLKNLAESQGFHVPTLEETLRLLAGKNFLEIELKETGYEQQVLDTVLKFFRPKDFRIISFNQASLKTIRKINFNIELGLVIGRSNFEDYKKLALAVLRRGKDYDVLNLHYRWWRCGLVNLLPFRSKKVFLWAVDDESTAKKIMRDEKIAGFSTNRLAAMLTLKKTL